MATRNRKKLVIDTDIACKASGLESIAPETIGCRDFLKACRGTRHFFVFYDPLYEEWRRHLKPGSFAMIWLRQMAQQGRVDFGACSEWDEIRALAFEILTSRKARAEIEKDFHLVEAAKAADGIIASCDRVARKHFAKVAKSLPRLGQFLWVDPTIPEEDAAEWIKDVAKQRTKRKLANFPS